MLKKKKSDPIANHSQFSMSSPRVGLCVNKPCLRGLSKDGGNFPSIQERDEELYSDCSATESVEEEETPQSN